MSVAEIEAAIQILPKEDLARFNAWYQEYMETLWDKQIRQDAAAGKLDFLINEAREERDAGTLKQFP